MPTSTNVTNLKINELTEAQYDTAVQQGIIGANELSVLTDAEAGQVIQVATMPTAAAGELDKIYQFVGTTDANYTNGYFYKCVSDGQDPATYSWTQTDVQPQAGGLPSQTGNAGKFLTTDGTDASWATINALQNTATGNYATTSVGILSNSFSQHNSVAIGRGARCNASNSIVISNGGDSGAKGGGSNSITIGNTQNTGNTSNIMIGNTGSGSGTLGYGSIYLGWKTSGTVSLGTYSIYIGGVYGNNVQIPNGTMWVGVGAGDPIPTKLLDADGTIPTDRYTTTPSADGTYVPTLTISSGTATRTWGAAASAPVVPATMPTLAVADWSSNTQTVNVTGVTASNIVFVSPAPASAADYAAAGIVCTAQGSGTLTFTCTTVPSNAITVNVVILG